MSPTNNSNQQQPAPQKSAPGIPSAAERSESVNSAAFFEAMDEYDDVDDFGVASTAKVDKRHCQRGGGGGSNSVYSSKHVRAKAAQQSNKK